MIISINDSHMRTDFHHNLLLNVLIYKTFLTLTVHWSHICDPDRSPG